MSEPHRPGLWPVPGDGVLARHGNLVLLSGVESTAVVDALLDLLERTAAEGGDGRQFTDQVAAVIEANASGQPVLAFGLAGADLRVAVSDGAWAEVVTEHGVTRLEASQPGMLLRCTLRTPVTGVRGGLDPANDVAAATDRFSRLDGGTVRAGGLSFYAGPAPASAAAPPQPAPAAVPVAAEPAGAAVPEPVAAEPAGAEPAGPVPLAAQPLAGEPVAAEPAPAPREPMPTEQWPAPSVESAGLADAERQRTILPQDLAELGLAPPGPAAPLEPWPPPAAPAGPVEPAEPFEAVLLSGPALAADVDLPDRPPLPKVADLPPGTSSYVSEAPIIQGVYCKNGHFDDPEALFCAVCGISMNQQTLVPRPGARPPLGVLVLDDGAVFQLDHDYVIGREPTLDASVASGRARPLKVTDDSGIVSRVHAGIQLDGWRVLLSDLGSANGTRVRLPKQDLDAPLAPQVPVVLAAGSQIDLGGRMFRYESHRGR